jgi:DNA-binding transcriptional ArsR family regulator
MTDLQAIELMAALASAARMRLLRALHHKALRCSDPVGCDLSGRCCTVSELAEGLDMSLATASHHLKELRRAGLITVQRRGRNVFCAIDAQAVQTLTRVISSFAPAPSQQERSHA